jgi:predicted amidohydrolase
MRVDAGRKEENLERAAAWIGKAADQGADVVLLPEALTLGWTDPSARSQADAIPDSLAFARLACAAGQHKIYICAGIIERDGAAIYNSAVLIDPNGALILQHRKLNELEIAHELYGVGNRLGVATTPFGRIGLMICADGFARGQVITRTLGYMGADVILSPCAWAVAADHDDTKTPYGQIWIDNYCPPASQFRMWIAGASNVGWIPAGPWKGRKCIGCSLLVGPDGTVVRRGPYGVDAETMLVDEITPERRPHQGTTWP